MLDPLPIKPFPLLSLLTTRIAPYLSLETLPLHAHEILLSALLYHTICAYVSPALSSWLFPNTYPKLPRRTKVNWDVHVVSLFQSTLISVLALWVLWNDEERGSMGYRERVWGYTGANGMVEALAAGYFAWDLWVSTVHLDVFGVGLLAHAISAFGVYLLGFRPFVNYYAPIFILYELSSPFLNFHWFFDKLGMTGSKAQLYNGIMLMSTFFGCRLVWGPYQTWNVFSDIWKCIQYQKTAEGQAWLKGGAAAASAIGSKESSEIWRYTRAGEIPLLLAGSYFLSNTILMALNVYWFGKMVETIRKRFDPPFGTRKKDEGRDMVMGRGVYADGRKSVEIDSQEIKHRSARPKPYEVQTPPPQ